MYIYRIVGLRIINEVGTYSGLSVLLMSPDTRRKYWAISGEARSCCKSSGVATKLIGAVDGASGAFGGTSVTSGGEGLPLEAEFLAC